jgi:tetratricopeptide (TPR) repeat protein
MADQDGLVVGADPATAEVLTLKNAAAATLLDVFAHSWPKLNRLELEIRGDKTAAKSVINRLEGFLETDVPALRHLCVGGAFDDSLLRLLIDSPLLDQLESLEFSVERLSSETRAAIVQARDKFAQLLLFPKAEEIMDARILLGRAQLARDLGLLERAIELLDRAVEQGGNHLHLLEKASILAGLERYDDALAAIEQALVRDPYYFPCWIQRVEVLRRLGRLDEALAAAKEARRRVHKEEHRLQAVASAMVVLQESKRVQDMETEAMWALADIDDEEDPSALTLFWMAAIHALLNNVDAAMGRLEAACEKEPSLRNRARDEAMLQSLRDEPRFKTLLAKSAP